MKTFFKIIVATIIVGFMSASATLKAQTTYNLWIAGMQVTSANAGDITAAIGNPDVAKGIIKYDDATKTLTLNGAAINTTASGSYAILSNESGLTIKLIGTNNVDSEYSAIRFNSASATIKGSPFSVLDVEGVSDIAIYTKNCNLTITGGCEVSAKGENYGITGNAGDNEELTISGGSTVYATGQNNGSIMDIKSLVLKDGAIIASPDGAHFDATKKAVVDGGGNVVKERVYISPTYYNLWVGDVHVNTANASDITASIADPTIATGGISYDNTTKTLTLSNARIIGGGSQSYGIDSYIESFNIKLIGDNYVGGDGLAVGLRGTSTIIGAPGAKFEIVDNSQDGCTYIPNLTITGGCEVVANGIDGSDKYTLTISGGSILKSTEPNHGSVIGLVALVLKDGAEIVSPAGAKFDATKKAVVDASGNIVTEEVIIRKPLGVENTPAAKVAIYPNPASLQFIITSDETITNVEITTLLGQQVLRQTINDKTAKVNIDKLSQGGYIVKAFTNVGVISKKLSIVK